MRAIKGDLAKSDLCNDGDCCLSHFLASLTLDLDALFRHPTPTLCTARSPGPSPQPAAPSAKQPHLDPCVTDFERAANWMLRKRVTNWSDLGGGGSRLPSAGTDDHCAKSVRATIQELDIRPPRGTVHCGTERERNDEGVGRGGDGVDSHDACPPQTSFPMPPFNPSLLNFLPFGPVDAQRLPLIV
ncbi:hypothetical protein K488DRAFT_75252, partial [Vararia minispora EC-137]